MTQGKSFDGIQVWHQAFIKHAAPEDPSNFPFALVGNKADLRENAVITEKQGSALAKKLSIPIFRETSALNGDNIVDVFESLVSLAIHSEQETKGEGFKIQTPTGKKRLNKKKCCD